MPAQRNGNAGFSFVGMVVGVMTLLKIKGKYDEYKQTAADDEEGRVALVSPSTENLRGPNEGGIALLDTEIPVSMRRTKKKPGCCVCCGVDFTLFWKAVGIVLGLWTLYVGYKAVRWALTDAPTGLENMPEFSTSLGCADAPHIYNGTMVTVMVPIATEGKSSSLDIRGGAVGTVLVADGADDATEIKYELTLRTTKESLLSRVGFVTPDKSDDGKTIRRSRWIVDMPYLTANDEGECMRYDITVYLPPNLRQMHVQTRTLAHVSFAEGTTAKDVNQLTITQYALQEHNILVPAKSVVSKDIRYESFRGYIVGEAAIANELSIETQRGDAIANVKIVPTPAEEGKKALLRTVGGAGRSDFIYIGSKQFVRNIEATHTSSRNADLYLTYRGADINGKIEMESKSYTVTGAQSFGKGSTGGEDHAPWTHFVGDQNGGDEIHVNSRGWTGLYF